MKKFVYLLSVVVVSFVINSCSTSDPEEVYGSTYQDFPGPRYLFKMEDNFLLKEEYTANSGVVNRIDEYDYDGTIMSEHHRFTVEQSGGKISSLEYFDDSSDSNKKIKYVPTHDGSGKMVSYVKDAYTGTQHDLHGLGEITYDLTGRITKIFEKTAVVTTPNVYNYTISTESNIVYNGESNIAKVSHITKNYNSSNQVISTYTDVYEYPTFDEKLNPYLVVPKDYNILYATFHPEAVVRLSPNNPKSMKFSNAFLPAPQETMYSYTYDQQGYVITNGTQRFLYKKIK